MRCAPRIAPLTGVQECVARSAPSYGVRSTPSWAPEQHREAPYPWLRRHALRSIAHTARASTTSLQSAGELRERNPPARGTAFAGHRR